MLGQINSSQITKTITWVFIRVNPLGQKLAIFLSSFLSQSDLLVSLCFFCHVFSGRSWVFPGRTVPKNKDLWYTVILQTCPMDMQGGWVKCIYIRFYVTFSSPSSSYVDYTQTGLGWKQAGPILLWAPHT